MVIDKCSVAWTESRRRPPYTYTCGGTTSASLASTPVIVTDSAMSNLVLTAGTDNYARVTLTLPTGAPNILETQTSTVNYTFTATQRAGTGRLAHGRRPSTPVPGRSPLIPLSRSERAHGSGATQRNAARARPRHECCTDA